MQHTSVTLTYLLLNPTIVQFVLVVSVLAGGDCGRIEAAAGD